MQSPSIPIYQPDLSGNETKYVNMCLNSTWISSKGEFIDKFEKAFASYCGLKYAATTSNGTAALHLALLALNVGPGDEVIVPTLTYIAPVNAITYTGAKAIFVDSLPDTWQMDKDDVEKKITPRTKAIMVVHLYGHPCDMDKIMAVAKKYKLKVIEDCAEAIGSKYMGTHVGNFGDLACFSFYGNKTITTGEGGMVATNNNELLKKVLHLKKQGLAEGQEYWHDIIGYNYRMSNICAAIGLAQIERIKVFIKHKLRITSLYEKKLRHRNITFHKRTGEVEPSYWMCSILLSNNMIKNKLREYLAGKDIETRPFVNPVHKMPIYLTKQSLPVAENLAQRGINLPSWPGLTNLQINHIASEIVDYIEVQDGQ